MLFEGDGSGWGGFSGVDGGEPQGAPSKNKRQKQDGVNDDDDDNEYVQGNYPSLVQIT